MLWLGYKHQREVIRVIQILEIHKVKIIIEGPTDMVFNAKKVIIYPRRDEKKYIEAEFSVVLSINESIIMEHNFVIKISEYQATIRSDGKE